jgi:hypothetical protein
MLEFEDICCPALEDHSLACSTRLTCPNGLCWKGVGRGDRQSRRAVKLILRSAESWDE